MIRAYKDLLLNKCKIDPKSTHDGRDKHKQKQCSAVNEIPNQIWSKCTRRRSVQHWTRQARICASQLRWRDPAAKTIKSKWKWQLWSRFSRFVARIAFRERSPPSSRMRISNGCDLYYPTEQTRLSNMRIHDPIGTGTLEQTGQCGASLFCLRNRTAVVLPLFS